MRSSERTGPRISTPEAGPDVTTPHTPDTASIGNSGRCWRCGVLFSDTTADDLARCAELARASEPEHPLHYTDDEVVDGWADDAARLWEWLARRAAGEREDP